jgi:hypothetical protein
MTKTGDCDRAHCREWKWALWLTAGRVGQAGSDRRPARGGSEPPALLRKRDSSPEASRGRIVYPIGRLALRAWVALRLDLFASPHSHCNPAAFGRRSSDRRNGQASSLLNSNDSIRLVISARIHGRRHLPHLWMILGRRPRGRRGQTTRLMLGGCHEPSRIGSLPQ